MFNIYRALVAEEFEDDVEIRIERRVFRENIDPFSLEDNAFLKNFRLTKTVVMNLINRIKHRLDPASGPKTYIPAHIKVLCALSFYGSGSYQTVLGNSLFSCMSQTSVSKCIRTVTEALLSLGEIRFPANNLQRNRIQEQFRVIGLPGIIGCVDGTHVAITTPYEREDVYVNRKGYHSINVQIICDYKLRILNIVVKYPGSTHDAFIWRNSRVYEIMKANHFNGDVDSKLLGDSGYPLQPWLLTPYNNPPANSLEGRYNELHSKARSCVERCILKGRFRCLLKDRTLHYQPRRACRIIMSCATLHNIALSHDVPNMQMLFDDIDLDPPVPIDVTQDLRVQGQQMRDLYVQNL